MNEPIRASIVIDQKKSRIRIHRSTLYALGRPDCLQLLVNPEKRTFLLRKALPVDSLTFRVHPDLYRTKQCFEIYSSSFIEALRSACTDWKKATIYTVAGEIMPNQGVALFRFEDAVPFALNETAL